MGEGLFQPFHILLIVAIALLIFGPSKFASLGKGLGRHPQFQVGDEAGRRAREERKRRREESIGYRCIPSECLAKRRRNQSHFGFPHQSGAFR